MGTMGTQKMGSSDVVKPGPAWKQRSREPVSGSRCRVSDAEMRLAGTNGLIPVRRRKRGVRMAAPGLENNSQPYERLWCLARETVW